MLVEGDFERVSRAAAAAAAHKRRRPSAVPQAQAVGGWASAGRSGASTFWPRYLDIRLVADGVRCAVLLDTRRAPRGSAPLADVLDALQEEGKGEGGGGHQQEQRDKGAEGGGHSTSCDVACLGLLVLEGSLFLVNRALLLLRLKELFSTEPTAERRSSCGGGAPADTAEKHTSVAEAAAGGVPSSGRTSQPAPPASSSGAGAQRQRRGRRTFALVDVRKSLALPCDRSDALAPRLGAALRSAFWGVAIDGADHNPQPHGAAASNTRRGSKAPETAAAAAVGSRADGHGHDGGPCLVTRRGEEGARWLRDWATKELALDCESLGETLGGVGLCGLAGWLLEYPVVYCCPSRVRPPDGADRAGGDGGTTAEIATGNCLAAVPLTVYSLSVDLGGRDGAGGCGHAPPDAPSGVVAGSYSHAFSFSVPERVCGSAGAEGDEEGARAGLQGLVDNFLGRLEARLARHRGSGSSSSGGSTCGRDERLACGLNVSKRTETLDRVAL